MVKIITKSNTDEIAESIARAIADSPAKLIRIEGVCGSGKTTIAQKLQARGVGLHINADHFAGRPAVATPYPGCVKQNEFDAAIADAHQNGESCYPRCRLFRGSGTRPTMGTWLEHLR